MMIKSVVAVALTLALTSTAMAAGSTSPSQPPVFSPPKPTTYDLGLKAVRAGDFTRALTLFQQVVDAEPRNADGWNYLGYSHRQLKRFDESLAAYQKALAINPNHRGANEYLGELYLQTGDLPKAQERLDSLKRLCPRGCKEYEDLSKAIKAYELARKSG